MTRGESRAQQELWQREAWWLGVGAAIAPRLARTMRRRGARILMIGRGTAPLAATFHRPGMLLTVVESDANHWESVRAELDAAGISAIHGDPGRVLAACRPPVYTNGTTNPSEGALAPPPREDLLLAVRALEGESAPEAAAMLALMTGAARQVLVVELEPSIAAWWRLAAARRGLPSVTGRSQHEWKTVTESFARTHRVRHTTEPPLRIVDITERRRT